VTSIVGRFLEHSRIYYFKNGGDEQIYLGSADLMPRNINRRVEVLFPVEDPQMINYLSHDVLDTYLKANQKVRRMKSDGTYYQITPKDGEEPLDAQSWMINWHLNAYR
jgi:polyphosphate kinase